MNWKILFKKYWFWALVWFAVSVIASIIRYDVVGPFGDITHLTVYYTPFMFLFFPTLLTYFIVGEPAAGYFSNMVLNHIVAIPVYFAVCYIVYFVIKKFRK